MTRSQLIPFVKLTGVVMGFFLLVISLFNYDFLGLPFNIFWVLYYVAMFTKGIVKMKNALQYA